MVRPRLTLALSLYDRHVPLFDGTAKAGDIDLQVLAVGEANSLRDGGKRHHRMLFDREFDACEVSLSSYIMARSRGLPFIAIPVFPRRLFTHSNIWVRRDGSIREPQDLMGRRVGVITFQTTLSVQAKGDLQSAYGVPWRGIEWHVAAEEPLEFPSLAGLGLKRIPREKKLGELLASGSIDALIAPRPPAPVLRGASEICRLFSDAPEEERLYFHKHGFFPAMHVMALKEETVQEFPWVPASLIRAFREAQEICRSYYADPNWTMHAWMQQLFEQEQDQLGLNLWPLGLEGNRRNLELFLDYLLDQGLVAEKLPLEHLFIDESRDAKREA
jgi:4,5-dihydroxyphthalate decarboxylase